MSLGAVLSVLPAFYDTFYYTISVIRDTVKMATMYTIKSLPMLHKQRTTLWRLEICLKSRVGNSRVSKTLNKENVARIKNFCYNTC